ncbi:sperm acrosome-associated protein 5-like [Tiliqua scincoides]|uniref:sperm acrosome-associated protein 5-like n=1 Tax=Tiliqua scincoides TaxID=71010 RepID=UPI0034633AC9
MKALRVMAIVICLAIKTHSKFLSRCELVLILQRSGMDGYAGYNLADWVCLAYYVSGFNTAAVTYSSDGTTEYGIFQLNSGFWCADGYSKTRNLCDLPCRDLLTDQIQDDIVCLKRAAVGPDGLDTWMEWRDHCRNRDLSHWIAGCNL